MVVYSQAHDDIVVTPATTIAVTGTNTVTTITMPVVDDPNLITSVATVIIMDISDDVILVKPVDGSAELKSSSKFSLSAKQLPADITPQTGMKLEITYNGGILETYPAMFGNIQKVTVVSDANTDNGRTLTDFGTGGLWSNPENSDSILKNMTLNDVIELSQKGNDLDWNDFKGYNGKDVGSGQYIWEYKFDDGYILRVIGVINKKPDYILLSRNNDKGIDIRTDDVKEYIASSATPVSDNSKSIGEDSLSISEEIKEHFRVYETYSDENTKPERRLVQDFKSIMRYYNVPVRSAFTEYDNIDDILVSKYVLQKLYIVEQQDGSFKYYDEDLTEIKSSSSYLNIPEKAYTAFWDKDFVNKYISSNAKLENIYYISGEINQMGTAIYYKTTVGDYVYFYHYSIGEKLFSIEDFCKYQKAISDELAKHPNENDGSDIDISSIMDLSKYDLKNITSESERLKGDANCDGQVDLADAVMIMQALANPNKYGLDGTAEHHLTEQGKLNGDMDGDGLTVGDAQAIQRKLLGLVDTLTIQTPPVSNSYLYESYNDLNEALIKQDSSILVDSNNYGELFNKTVSAFGNKDIDLYVPAIDGKACDLKNKEGFSNISLMTAELYNLPWIWYHCKVNKTDVDVKLAYHSVIESSELNSAKTYYEVLKVIAPDAPNPDNYAKFESYQKIYESEITLVNDKKVVAMILEIANSSNVYVMFVYEGKLVSIYANKDALSESFWSSFSLEKY
ncbi:dockerin type I repeat-containing protein [Ruminococcus flavefaciens]|uniref:dockerin type I repeat-containing protein n=1 Tax=Ruminococcus flavefaciens TaxID=1265 RepID=UPI0002D736DB|nr:dockerin type I repeat-containing protein [Ruminococcus flavefaciens]